MRRSVLALLLCVAAPALAQVHVCMGGDLDSMTAVEKQACENQVRIAGDAAAAAHVSDDWHMVVVCGDQGWNEYTAFTNRAGDDLASASFDSDRATHTIFLRGSSMTSSSATVSLVAQAAGRTSGGLLLASR